MLVSPLILYSFWSEKSGIPFIYVVFMLVFHSGIDGKPLRRLDCAVIERLYKMNEDLHRTAYDSVRGIIFEGGSIYPGSGILKKTYVQICVRNPNCIMEYFAPKDFSGSFVRINKWS